MNTEKVWWRKMCNDTFYLVLHEHSCCLDEQEPERYTKAIIQEQKKRDWEEFRELLDAHMMKSGMRRDIDALRGVREDIDAKLAELNKPKE